MNLLFIIVVTLQTCTNVTSQPGTGWDPAWGPQPAPAPSPSRGPTQGTSGNPFWGSPPRSTGSSSWRPTQSSTRGSSSPSQGTCNCGLYETCAMVRNGNAAPKMGCINALETEMLRTALGNTNAGTQGSRGNSRDSGASQQQSLNPRRGRIDTFGRESSGSQSGEAMPGLGMLGVGRTPGTGSRGFPGRFDQGINGQPQSDFNMNIPGIQGPSGLMETNPGPNNQGEPPQVLDPITGGMVQRPFNDGQPRLGEIVPRPRAQIRGGSRGGHIIGGGGSRNTPRFHGDTRATGERPGTVEPVSSTEHGRNTGIQGRVSNILEDEYGIHFLFYTPGVSTGLRVNITKTGFCSRMPPTRSFQACVPSCSSDTECSGTRKCCPNGCSIGCVAPNQEQAVQTNTITATASNQPPGRSRQRSRSRNGNGDLPGRPRRRFSQRRAPSMRLVKTNDITRTRSSEARISNGQRPRTFGGHRGSDTGRSVQQPDVKFISRRQGNVRNTPRSGQNSGVQPGIDLATHRDIPNTGTRTNSRLRQTAAGIRGRHVADSINRNNRHSTPPARQRQTTTRQVQWRRNDLASGSGGCGGTCRGHADCNRRFDISYFCLAKPPCSERSCQRVH